MNYLDVIVRMKAKENQNLRDMVVSENVQSSTTFPPFWSVRPPSGILLGTNFVGPYKDVIRDIIEAGNNDKSQKLGAAQMQERIRYMYPGNFDVPSTYHIGSYVTSYRSGKKGSEREHDDHEEDGDVVKEGPMAVRYLHYIDIIARENHQIADEYVVNAVKEPLGIEEREIPDDLHTNDRLMKKAGTIKGNVRKEIGILSGYVIPTRYAVTIEPIVRGNAKLEPEVRKNTGGA